MRLQTMVMAVLLFSAVVVIMSTALASFVTEYNPEAGTIDVDQLDQLDEINATIGEISSSLQQKNRSFFSTDTFNAFIISGFSTAKLIYQTPPFIQAIIVSLSTRFGLDPIIGFIIMSAIFALIGFAFVSAIMKWKL